MVAYIWGWIAIAAIGAVSCDVPSPAVARYEQVARHMGTDFRIVLYADDEMSANQAFAAAFAHIGELDRIMSDYLPDSELNQLSISAPHATPVAVSEPLFDILQRSERFSELSGGAFDVTVGPLTKLWRRSRRQRQLPPPEQVAQARAAVGYQAVKLDPERRSVQLLRPEMRLDLGGIAQGYAADEALRIVRAHGIQAALVNASGDIVAGAAPPFTAGWKVGVAPLQEGAPPSRFLMLENGAISTSGDAFQFVEIVGVRYSHIVDPQTGLGLTQRSSVTILAPDCTTADALATAVSILPLADGLRLVESMPDVAALIVRAEADEVQIRTSQRFPKDAEAEKGR